MVLGSTVLSVRTRSADTDESQELFLKTLGQACEKTDWQIHAWCLMSTHFHLVVETPRPNLVAGMKWLLGTYTNRFNRRHDLFGHLFSGESAEAKAERVVQEELRKLKWEEAELGERRKGD